MRDGVGWMGQENIVLAGFDDRLFGVVAVVAIVD